MVPLRILKIKFGSMRMFWFHQDDYVVTASAGTAILSVDK